MTALTEVCHHAKMSMYEVSVCFCCCRSVEKTDPVWFSDVSGQHLSKEIYGHTDTLLHTLASSLEQTHGSSASLRTRPVLSAGAD